MAIGLSCGAQALSLSGEQYPAGLKVGASFIEAIEKINHLILTQESWAPFKDLSNPLKVFVAFEKRLNRVCESRVAVNREGRDITGFTHVYSPLEAPYDASSFEPFKIKGVWIPESEGDLYTHDRDLLEGVTALEEGVSKILFFIHPMSYELYGPLLEKYGAQSQEFSVIALSSVRSLLVALPSMPRYEYCVAKLSLDAVVGRVLRHLTKKECYVSVENSFLLDRDRLPILNEQVSFVPKSELVSSEKGKKDGAGMIYRFLSSELFCDEAQEFIIPFFSILGENNKDFLLALVEASGLDVENFIADKLLQPLARLMVANLFDQQTSYEIHGQNLLVFINKEDGSFQFGYRDLGGVNRLARPTDSQNLPPFFKKEDFSWRDNHTKDAAKVVEDLVHRVIFNLTKMVFNDQKMLEQAPTFCMWKEEMLERQLDLNWKIIDDEGNHQQQIPIQTYVRYGFFEKLFGNLLAEEIKLFLPDQTEGIDVFKELLQPQGECFTPCYEREWFRELILRFYHPLTVDA